jgi:hypothetical protein
VQLDQQERHQERAPRFASSTPAYRRQRQVLELLAESLALGRIRARERGPRRMNAAAQTLFHMRVTPSIGSIARVPLRGWPISWLARRRA